MTHRYSGTTEEDLKALVEQQNRPPRPAKSAPDLAADVLGAIGRVVGKGVDVVADTLKRQQQRINQLELELDRARADARVLAHSYRHDSRPPEEVVEHALAYQGRWQPAQEPKG